MLSIVMEPMHRPSEGFARGSAKWLHGVKTLVVDNLGCLGRTFTAGYVYWVDGLWGLLPIPAYVGTPDVSFGREPCFAASRARRWSFVRKVH